MENHHFSWVNINCFYGHLNNGYVESYVSLPEATLWCFLLTWGVSSVHRGTSSYHPFLLGILPNKNPPSELGGPRAALTTQSAGRCCAWFLDSHQTAQRSGKSMDLAAKTSFEGFFDGWKEDV